MFLNPQVILQSNLFAVHNYLSCCLSSFQVHQLALENIYWLLFWPIDCLRSIVVYAKCADMPRAVNNILSQDEHIDSERPSPLVWRGDRHTIIQLHLLLACYCCFVTLGMLADRRVRRQPRAQPLARERSIPTNHPAFCLISSKNGADPSQKSPIPTFLWGPGIYNAHTFWRGKQHIYKWKNHFYEMKGDVGMSLHEKERNKKMPTPRHKVTHNPIPTSLCLPRPQRNIFRRQLDVKMLCCLLCLMHS